MVNKVRTINFLPEVFQTVTNKQFLSATLDVLTSQPDFRRVQGFIGEKYGYGVEPADRYVVEPTKARRDYQMDPGVIFLKPDTQTAQDFINYPGMIDALELQNAVTINHDRLWNNEFYSWDPFIDLDKIVNYSQYYWIPSGPDSIPITTATVYLTGDYPVSTDDGGYVFTDVAGTNPTISVLRGGTYTFVVPAGAQNFWLQEVPGVNATTLQRTIPGVTGNGSTGATITFVVPNAVTLPLNLIYYQAGDDPNSVGVLQLIENNTTNYIDVDQIIGRKTYISPNGVKFTNGLKVRFEGSVYPTNYANSEYYVSGVGTAIKLLPVDNYIVPEVSGQAIYNYWDKDPWDILSWDIQLDIPVTPDYITITRDSADLNAWTRSNRWFHEDVVSETTKFLGSATSTEDNAPVRAKRPVIEFRGNLKLFNSGTLSIGPVDLFDTATTDAFSQLEGQTLASIGLIDGVNLFAGATIVFSADTNPAVKNKVYQVNLVPVNPSGDDVVALVPVTGYTVTNNSQVIVINGSSLIGTTWRYMDDIGGWIQCQKKIQVNQAPLYDIFNNNGQSLSDSGVYPATNFSGTKLFSYTLGTGSDDPVLGFPISYANNELIGDIQFTVNLNSDTFIYNVGETVATSNINIGYVYEYIDGITPIELTGWIPAAAESFQYQVFEFPITETLNYSASNVSLTVDSGGSGYAAGDIVKLSGTLFGGVTPTNDLYVKVSAVGGGGAITALDTASITGICPSASTTVVSGFAETVTGLGTSAIITTVVEGVGTTTFTCDIPVDVGTTWKNIIVYLNDTILEDGSFTWTVNNTDGTTKITIPTVVGSKTTILLISGTPSKTAYYQTPTNLENNPFNENITSVAVGDLRNQYRTIFTNAPGVMGILYGNNNIHDLGNLYKYGTAIIQNSSSLVLPGLFLRKQNANLLAALQWSSEQYIVYKTLLTDLAIAGDYNVWQTPAAILDDIIYTITTVKKDTASFFWSDMVFSGTPYITNTYNFGAPVGSATFDLDSTVWSPQMFTEANYNGLAVYITRTTGTTTTTNQLLRGVDYFVSTTAPAVTIVYNILADDVITVSQYNQTYGSWCPATPTKLGLYSLWVPQIVLNDTYTTATWFILGHDGSYTKLWGTYDPATETLSDIRDKVLFEFEKRVYNNYKVDGVPPLNYATIVPGQFRTTEYSQEEILQMYSISFLNWVGANRIDYKTQVYNSTNKFTFNYNQTTNKLSGSAFLQGYWRGICNWLYDTDNPAAAPWEMLGLIEKPSWWDTRYGSAPYTSGNTFMWSEIASGIIWNNGNPYVDESRVRPELLEVLPVDSYGDLVPPFYTAMSNYNSLTFNRDWIVGDGAPAEASYLKSSTWPFDFIRLLAITKPAKFYNLFVDMDRYKWNVEFQQYLYDGRYHLDPRTVEVYGSGTAKHSYLNFIVDYINQSGANGYTVITGYLQNLDVRLTYRMAGFTAKNYLKFLVEKATPNSKNFSLLIPDESYGVLLYDNPPEENLSFSSVVVQKVEDGYIVYGNSKNKHYFTTLVGRPGQYITLRSGAASVQVSKNWYADRTIVVPYGSKFYSMDAVCSFLQNYGAYLTQQGAIFGNIINGIEYTWARSAQEFLAWAQQDWSTGSIISLNPSAKKFVVEKPGLVVQPLQLQGGNFILNQNLLPIQQQNSAVIRQGENFTVDVLSNGDAISIVNLGLHSIEHAIVFDNLTVFGDVIYNLITGLRQPRLLLQGYKTGEWNGYVDAAGFIINQTDIPEWTQDKKYPKNSIIKYKSKYWVAVKLIEASSIFSLEDWLETNYDDVKSILLPNPSTLAYESQFYYDTNRANLENDADLLAFSLIGFRPRNYLAAADLSDITQVNLFKNIIKYKGTNILANAFKGVTFDQGKIDYEINENWAIKYASFGSVLNRNYIEAQLDQGLLKGNPTLIGFSQSSTPVVGVQQSIPISNFINFERPPTSPNFLPEDTTSYTVERGIPSAGYVNLGDSQLQAYYLTDLGNNPANIANLVVGDVVWIANYRNSWGIFEALSLQNQVIFVENNLDGTIKITFARPHGLSINDILGISGFDNRINGFYTVQSIYSNVSVVVPGTLNIAENRIAGLGVGYKLVQRRYVQPSDAYNSAAGEWRQWSTRKIWADYDLDNQWAVYGSSQEFRQAESWTGAAPFTVSIAYTSELGKLAADGAGSITRYRSSGSTEILTGGVGSGSTLIAFGTYFYCSSPDEGLVYVYELNTLTDTCTLIETVNPTIYITNVSGPIAVGSSRDWLWIADTVNQEIAVYALDKSLLPPQYQYVDTLVDPSVPVSCGWGSSLATSIDGAKLVVGAPDETILGVTDAGSTYVYSRHVERFISDGITITYTLGYTAPSNFGDVLINGVLQTSGYTLVGTTLTFTLAPSAGSVITVSTGATNFVQKFTSSLPHQGALFGNSVTTNRYGADILVGVPYELSTVDNIPGVEGAVYRYTNSGQRYGVVNGSMLADKTITVISRSAGVVTVTTSTPHGLTTGDSVSITGITSAGTSFDGIFTPITTSTPTTFTYAQVGVNEVGTTTTSSIVGIVQTGTIWIDGYRVNYSGTISTIVTDINTQTPTNIVASNTDNILTLTVLQDTPEVVYDILDVTGSPADLAKLGIILWQSTQVIKNNLTYENVSTFGWLVQMDQADNLIISAPNIIRWSPTTFDYTENCNKDDTLFDGGTTTFVDDCGNTGVVFVYSYLPAAAESITNPGKYAFGQYIGAPEILQTATQPRFGWMVAYLDGVILAGTPWWSSTLGGFAEYTTTWVREYSCQAVESTVWYVDKKPLTIVDVNALNNISIYNITNNQTLEFLDYIDPGLGKLLGAVQTNIDFQAPVDPASYADNGVSWGINHVGQTWLDTKTIRLLNYHQPDYSYNAKNWGVAFPGSTADVYTWIESIVLPSNYAGPGIPYSLDSWTSATAVDGATNSLITKYYFWVKNYDLVPPGKTLSPNVVGLYLLNPLNSGIAYLAPITTNVVALMNSGESIQTNTSVLHLGYGLPGSLDESHTSWNLIKQGDPVSFLPGLPLAQLSSTQNNQPFGLYQKFIESFAGFDLAGYEIPNPYLPELIKYGTSFRPRQSMFIDRLEALNVYLTYANNILINIPVVEIKDLSWLFTSGTTFDVSTYWNYVDWWAPGYNSNTKAVTEVTTVSELQTIISNEYVLIGGVQVLLEDGLIVKVKATPTVGAQFFVYNTNTGWTRIGLTNGTIQFLPILWNSTNGWSSGGWGGTWDVTPYQEIYWIIRWLNEKCYTNELLIARNNSLVLMFEYIQSTSLQQQNYLPWLNKTSLIDVKHKIRDLLPYKKYQRDNQEFLEGYLNEIKPYHVYIKEFVYTYTGSDTWFGNVTDFDLPAEYNSTTGYFQSPKLVYGTPVTPDEYSTTSNIWNEQQYSQWFQNRGVGISGEETVDYLISELDEDITSTSNTAIVKNAASFPVTGKIRIGSELLTYNGVDLISNTLVGLARGLSGTIATAHYTDDQIYIELPAVVVYNRGRGYTEPPIVDAYIDTGIWPQPVEAASVTSVVAGDQVIGVTVASGGSGYAITPEIIFESSSISGTFASANVNTSTNTITITGHPFVSGDCVIYSIGTGVAQAGLVDGGYYYTRSLDPNTVALYENYSSAAIPGSSPYLHVVGIEPIPTVSASVASDGRIVLASTGSGTDFTLTTSARANSNVTSRPVRELKIDVKFDRITYDYTPEWVAGSYYSALLPAVPTPTPTPTQIEFTITSIVSPSVVATVDFTPYVGQIEPAQLNGQKLKFVDAGVTIIRYYWIKVVTDTVVEIYGDPWFTLPIDPLAFPYIAGDNAYLTWPVDLSIDYVTYGGVLYKCIEANNDLVFDPLKWIEVEPSAADRIGRWYEPTPSMPGKVLSQLMAGVDYPNAIFLGQQMASGWSYGPWAILPWDFANTALDTILVSPSFTSTIITDYDVDGGAFLDGYTPEELVGCYVSDTVVITVTSNDISPAWNHSIDIDKFGGFEVYSDSGGLLDILYKNRWWYGLLNVDPTVDPSANTTLSTNASTAAVFLRT